ncbi:hypothetical protein [Mucilaginibacter ginsenosidivorans]|uniref:Uncharacterized protein n=1 Tax=Mucilaginibacter ginsenosidivorans TaxID=398053 RepID=A0A5B8UU84_9SPHI|nr:hypothetical protein [Mucilaginibacter ginsenosidivorans]QEC62459.1 hypothetical protein FRZ54_07615 [Mucilaginibacter ginsenosidivorans]
MEQYRKPDQYYIDEYDRMTIEELKAIEKLMIETGKRFHIDPDAPLGPGSDTEYIGYRIRYLDTGVALSRNKESSIQERMHSDEKKDRLIRLHPVPTNVRCDTCGVPMKFEMHDFLNKDDDPIFIFSCVNGHVPKKALFASGREYRLPDHHCQHCGGKLLTKKKKTKNRLAITETCKTCKNVEIMEFDISPKLPSPINEDERKKYCTDFKGRRNFYEDVKALADLSEIFGQQENKTKYGYGKVQQLNIAQLETTLTDEIGKAGFIKVQFDKPKRSRYLTVEFSAQDPTDREEAKSVKQLKKTIETALFITNWRLMSPGIEYKLGFLSGKLKGFSLEEDILKIAQEIWEKENRKL